MADFVVDPPVNSPCLKPFLCLHLSGSSAAANLAEVVTKRHSFNTGSPASFFMPSAQPCTVTE